MAARVSPLLVGASPQYAWHGANLQALARVGALSAGFVLPKRSRHAPQLLSLSVTGIEVKPLIAFTYSDSWSHHASLPVASNVHAPKIRERPAKRTAHEC
jgi:hypothetical protein